MFDHRSRRAGVQADACLGAGRFDGLQSAVRVGAGLVMGDDHVGTGVGIGLNIGIDGGDHQVHIHEGFHMRTEGLHGGRAECQVRHEMAVHHVDVYPVGTLCFDGLDFLTKVGEISRKDRRSDLDGTIKGHGGLRAAWICRPYRGFRAFAKGESAPCLLWSAKGQFRVAAFAI